MTNNTTAWIGTWRAAAASGRAVVGEALRSLVPYRLTAWLARDPGDAVVAVDANGLAALVSQIGSQRLGADPTEDFRRLAGPAAVLTITVPSTRAMVRVLSLPRAALTRLDDVLALDLERATPFKRGDVFSAAHLIATSDRVVEIAHVAIKRAPLDPLFDAATRATLPVKAVRLADGPYARLNLLPVSSRQRSRLTRWLRAATLFIAGGLVGLGLGFGGLMLWRLQDAITIAEAEQMRLAAAVSALRRQTQDADSALLEARFARVRRLEQPLVTSLWEELSQRLPNNTWLTELRIDDATIAIEGQSTNAADLVALLSRSPSFSSATFAAPITRDPQRGTERFQIRLTRRPPVARGAP
jgi:general secretion pathway protein L